MADPLGAHSLHPVELKALLGALKDGDPLLIYRHVTGALQLSRLASGARLTIGRKHEADIALTWDAEVSKVHAEAYELSGVWVVADDGLSSYGTFVNGKRVVARRRLHDEDRVRVGQTILVFRHQPLAAAVEDPFETVGPPDQLPQLTTMRKRVLVELCRPMLLHANALPATTPDIADAVHLSVHTVKDHLGALARLFQHNNLKRGEQRAAIADTALRCGLVSVRDLS